MQWRRHILPALYSLHHRIHPSMIHRSRQLLWSSFTLSAPGSSSPSLVSFPTPDNAHHLPPPLPMANPSFVWGDRDAETFMQSVTAAYSEVVHWKNNTFSIPYGNAGKKFVTELSKLYRAFAEHTALESIALKATTVMSVLLLQKPSHKSKPKDHSACLERRLRSWTEGDVG